MSGLTVAVRAVLVTAGFATLIFGSTLLNESVALGWFGGFIAALGIIRAGK